MMKKEWWYVVGLVVVILLIIFIFKDAVGLGPREKIRNGENEIIIDAINEYKNNKQVLEESKARFAKLLSNNKGNKENLRNVMYRFLENPDDVPESSKLKPEKIVDLSKFNLIVRHGEEVKDGEVEKLEFPLQLLDRGNNEIFDLELINPDNYDINVKTIFDSDVYKVRDKYFVDIKENEGGDSFEEVVGNSPITGLQVYTPPVPFNQVNRNFAVIIPYNSNFPLPSNAVIYLQAKLNNNVIPYFQANSEGTATYSFTIFPIQVNNYDPTGNSIYDIVIAADPSIDYSLYDMALIHIPSNNFGGFALMAFDYTGAVAYYPTNEPLIYATPVTYFDPSNPDPTQLTEYVTIHEMGHDLTAFNPAVNNNYFFGYLPHSRGFDQNNYPCTPNGPTIYCDPFEYGDQLSVMGSGRGFFSHHRAVHDLGFRSPISVQTVTSSGTFNLCSTNHLSPSNCPQELLIQDTSPDGANLAIELIANPLGPEYSLYSNCGNFFDSLILRATDIEQAGGLGNIFYSGQTYGGDVIFPNSGSLSNCLNPSGGQMIDFPLHQGQSVTTPLGTITFQSLTTTSTGGKQAVVNLVYTQPNCAIGPPLLQLNQLITSPTGNMQFYQGLIFPPNDKDSEIRLSSGSSCITPDTVTLTTQVTVQGTVHSDARTIPLPQGTQYPYMQFPIPQSLSTVGTGTYPFTLTAIPSSAPSQSTTVSGMLDIIPQTVPQITIAQTNYCLDLDPIQFNLQNLGANYFSPYPNIGAVVTPTVPIQGLPQTFYVPDLCSGYVGQFSNLLSATDVVCSSNIPGAPPNYGALIEKDCRFVVNNPEAFCYLGVCY